MARGVCVVGDMCGREGGHVHGRGGMCMAEDMCGRGVCVAGGVHEGHGWQGDMCAGETAIEVGGTHPTGLHSCSICVNKARKLTNKSSVDPRGRESETLPL